MVLPTNLRGDNWVTGGRSGNLEKLIAPGSWNRQAIGKPEIILHPIKRGLRPAGNPSLAGVRVRAIAP